MLSCLPIWNGREWTRLWWLATDRIDLKHLVQQVLEVLTQQLNGLFIALELAPAALVLQMGSGGGKVPGNSHEAVRPNDVAHDQMLTIMWLITGYQITGYS